VNRLRLRKHKRLLFPGGLFGRELSLSRCVWAGRIINGNRASLGTPPSAARREFYPPRIEFERSCFEIFSVPGRSGFSIVNRACSKIKAFYH